MSGGHFDYQQDRFNDIASEIENLILTNNQPNEWGDVHEYDSNVIEKFQEATEFLRKAQKMVHHIDYLVSGDIGVETFLDRWKKDIDSKTPSVVRLISRNKYRILGFVLGFLVGLSFIHANKSTKNGIVFGKKSVTIEKHN